MSCLFAFIGSVGTLGVDPVAYRRFVSYTEKSLIPADDTLAVSITSLFSGITAATILTITLLVLLVFILIVVALVSLGAISWVTALYMIVLSAACLALYYAIGYIFARKGSAEQAIPLQQSLRSSVVLAVNSIVRDAIFLTLCA